MDVELLMVPDCPNAGAAAVLLRRALNDVGLASVPIRTRVVSSVGEATQRGFAGSPTILIDGQDPFADPAQPVGLTCRVYVADGVRSGVPDLRGLRQALKRRADAHRTG